MKTKKQIQIYIFTLLIALILHPAQSLAVSLPVDGILAKISHPKGKAYGNKVNASQSIILKSELESTYKPASFDEFQSRILPQLEDVFEKSPQLKNKYKNVWGMALYEQYSKELMSREFGKIALEKIVEDYAKKTGVSTKVHFMVVDYVFDSFLQENAYQMTGYIPTHEAYQNSTNLSYKQMYDLLKQRVENAKDSNGNLISEVTFQTNWKYSRGTLGEIQKILARKNDLWPESPSKGFLGLELNLSRSKKREQDVSAYFWNFTTLDQWPAVSFTFERSPETGTILPENFEGFHNVIKEVLNTEHKKIAHKQLLQYILADNAKEYDLGNVARMTPDVVQKLVYELFNDHSISISDNYKECPKLPEPCLDLAVRNIKILTDSMFQPILDDYAY